MSINDIYILADKAFEEGNYSEAFKLFTQCAKNGDTASMGRIATMYTCGEGVECDYDKAIEWELKAIDNGNTSMLLNIGITYRIKGDIRKAKYWFEKSLESGDAEAALQLAKLYMVSDNEEEKIKNYLEIVINDGNSIEISRDEAKEILKEFSTKG